MAGELAFRDEAAADCDREAYRSRCSHWHWALRRDRRRRGPDALVAPLNAVAHPPVGCCHPSQGNTPRLTRRGVNVTLPTRGVNRSGSGGPYGQPPALGLGMPTALPPWLTFATLRQSRSVFPLFALRDGL